MCNVAQTQGLPPRKVKYACQYIGKEVLIDGGGNRNKTTPEVNIIDDKNTMLEVIPREYQQGHELVQNSCVWLAACLVVRSENSKLASILLPKYQQNHSKF